MANNAITALLAKSDATDVQGEVMPLEDVKTIGNIKDYATSLYGVLYNDRRNHTLATNAYVFNNPFLRVTIRNLELFKNYCVKPLFSRSRALPKPSPSSERTTTAKV